MARYRKKPIVIEAFQLTNEILDGRPPISPGLSVTFDRKHRCARIETLEGTMIALVGDWLICGVKGEWYPCKPDIFEATYEPA